MRGRAPVHEGTGAGLNQIQLGQRGGANNHLLTAAQLPAHNHALQGNTSGASTEDPSGGTLCEADANIYNGTAADVAMSATSVGNTGGNQQFSIMQPFLGINFIIALFGTFPSRN